MKRKQSTYLPCNDEPLSNGQNSTKVIGSWVSVVRLGTSDDFPFRFFSKSTEPTELQNQELIENSYILCN